MQMDNEEKRRFTNAELFSLQNEQPDVYVKDNSESGEEDDEEDD